MFDTFVITETGSRNDMQDRHFLYIGKDNSFILGGVFDGHGGVSVAENATKIIPKRFIEMIKKGITFKDAFKKSYKEASEAGGYDMIGSTALTFFIKDRTLAVANVGDSRMLFINGEKKFQLTTDHQTSNKDELARLKKHGATIKSQYVFKGDRGINLTRSLGNLDMKEIGVTDDPEIKTYTLPDNYVLVAASDGLWGYMKNESVRKISKSANDSERTCDLLMEALYKKARRYNYLDNTTIIIIKKN